MIDPISAAKVGALEDAARDFLSAADAGVEPVLNRTASRLLIQRARRIEAGLPVSHAALGPGNSVDAINITDGRIEVALTPLPHGNPALASKTVITIDYTRENSREN